MKTFNEYINEKKLIHDEYHDELISNGFKKDKTKPLYKRRSTTIEIDNTNPKETIFILDGSHMFRDIQTALSYAEARDIAF